MYSAIQKSQITGSKYNGGVQVLKKKLLIPIALLISGCSDSIDCNDTSIIEKIKANIVSLFSSENPPAWVNFSEHTDFELTGTKSGDINDEGVQICNFKFKVYPPVETPVVFSNTAPLSVEVRKNNDKLEYSERSLSNEFRSMMKNGTINADENVKPSSQQSELIEKHKKEQQKIKEEQQKEKEALDAKISKIKSIPADDYKLISSYDSNIYFAAMSNISDESKLLEAFSPAYKEEKDIFKKEDIKKAEISRINSDIDKMKSHGYIAVSVPMTSQQYPRTVNFFGKTDDEMRGYIYNNSNPSSYIMKGFNPSENTLDLSKTYFSDFCDKDTYNGGTRYTNSYAPDFYIANKNKLTSCVIKFKDRAEAENVYSMLNNEKDNDSAVVVNLYIDGVDGNNLNSYVTDIMLLIRDSSGNEFKYSTGN